MEFEIKRVITNEFTDLNLSVDLNELENYISEKIKNNNYGSSVVKYFWGFELFKFNGGFAEFFNNNIESWKYSLKWFLTNSHFDWNKIHKMNEIETLQLMKTELTISLGRIEGLKRKPKDFDYKKLAEDLERVFDNYLDYKKNI